MVKLMKFKNYIFVLIMVSLISGCQYEVSPWATDVDCPTSVSVEYNIERLKAQELLVVPGSEYKVALLSDPQFYPGAFEDVIKRINSMDDVAFILLSGDLAETGIKAEFEWTCKGMAKSNKPIFAVVGNHDALAFGKEIWLENFGPFDYSFSYQNSKFVAYNDNKYEFESLPDRTFLQQEASVGLGELRLNTFAVSHIPPWEKDIQLSQDLDDYGYDLTLHGHEHGFDFWQLFDVQLPHYVTSFTKEKEYGILTINGSTRTLENCRGSVCEPASVRDRIF
ncbi:MAG: Icc protein [Psychrobacter glaciei]|jgi:Icc protein